MARYSSYPTLYDDVHTVSITKLKEWDYLKLNQIKTGCMSWSTNGNKTGSIGIEVNTEEMYVRLFYTYQKTEKVDYKIRLVKIPSNLGRGELWYFVCPHTNKRCRKIYSIGNRFLHREAFIGCMYESQTVSKNGRFLDKYFSNFTKLENMEKRIYSKHSKSIYRGEATKHYKKYWSLLQQMDRVNIECVKL